MRNAVVMLCIAAALGGCAATPAHQVMSPTAVKYAVLDSRTKLFKDPASVRDARIGTVFAGINGSTAVCFESNAKNSFGGYTGLQRKILYVNPGSGVFFAGEPIRPDPCVESDFQPFPEINGVKS